MVLYAIEHIESEERVTLATLEGESLICYSHREKAKEFRDSCGLLEFCDIVRVPTHGWEFTSLYLDEHFATLKEGAIC